VYEWSGGAWVLLGADIDGEATILGSPSDVRHVASFV
jgi:hypothetical protein